MKKKYHVSIPVYATAYYTVFAESESEAIDIAAEEYGVPALCHHCSDEVDLGDYADFSDAVAEEIEGEGE